MPVVRINDVNHVCVAIRGWPGLDRYPEIGCRHGTGPERFGFRNPNLDGV